jgi:hypothetical protein
MQKVCLASLMDLVSNTLPIIRRMLGEVQPALEMQMVDYKNDQECMRTVIRLINEEHQPNPRRNTSTSQIV